MRVCILTKGEPYGWTRHYIQAFRQCCEEVLVVGPNITREELVEYNLGYLYDSFSPADIETALGPDVRLLDVLPPGWDPDLIVAISISGISLCPIFDDTRCPKVYLSIDTWQSPRDYLDAIAYDFVFAAQREFVPRLRAMGARRVSWLPLACNPAVHYKASVSKSADISFAGSIALPIHQERHKLLTRLQSEFAVAAQTSLYGHGLNKLCCSAKLTFNHSAVRDLNMRVFEALAMGVPLLTNREAEANGLLELFRDGEHLIVYNDGDDLVSKARAYLDNDAARVAIASAGRAEVLAKHTYRHRVESILATLRDQVPGFGSNLPDPHDVRPIISQLPSAPGVVVDVGLGLREAIAAIRNRGATAVYGLSPDSAVDTGAYDRVLPVESILESGAVDAFLIEDIQALEATFERIMRLAHDALDEGGTLLLRVTSAELDALELALDAERIRLWLLQRDFLFVHAKVLVDANTNKVEGCILVARKRTRHLADIVAETFAALPPNCEPVRTSVLKWCQNYPSGI